MKYSIVLISIGIMALASVVFAGAITPMAMSQKAIGGGAIDGTPTNGVDGGKGLNNIGLLIKTWGKVTYIDPNGAFFYIDDGSAMKDGFKDGSKDIIGIRVGIDNLATGNSISLTNIVAGQTTVTVVGVISTFADANQKIHPKLRPRYQADIILANP